MKPIRLWCPALLVAAAAVVLGCSDHAATGPAPLRPEGSLLGFLNSCSLLPSGTVSRTIGRAGGVIAVGPDTLRIPAGALDKAVTIQASLPAGYLVNIVVFGPNGLHFTKPASLTMGYSNCNLLASTMVQIAQVDDNLQVITYLKSKDNTASRTVTADVPHFSNYAIAW